ncbi:MAG TPA: ATP-binding protein [Sunxiuqinia sp.]|nr:ATP-binding protein [Sunxiuqinia sp.]
MKKTLTYLAICLLFFVVIPVHGFGQQKRILVIFSYNSTHNIYKESVSALNHVFPIDQFKVDVEFLDSKRYPDGKLYNNITNHIKLKEEGKPRYDIVIASNDNALNFCLENQKNLFWHIPIVFWGVNDLDKAFEQDKNEWVTGIATNSSFTKTLYLIKTIHSNHKKLVVITDSTTTGLADLKTFKQAITQFPHFQYRIINSSDYTLGEFRNRLLQIPDDAIIYHLASYRVRDDYLDPKETSKLLGLKKQNIIYTSASQPFSNGVLGSRQINYYEKMHEACEIARQVLDGAPISKFNVVTNSPYQNILDYNALKAHHVNLSRIPEGVIVTNNPTNRVEFTRVQAAELILAIVLVVLMLLIVILTINSRRKGEKSKRLFAENYLNIFKENHSMMLLIDTKTQKITDSNNAAARFYGYSKNELQDLPFDNLCLLPEIDRDAFFTQSQKRNSHFEQKHRTKKGQVKDVEIHSGKVILRNQTFIYTIIHDISQRIEADKELIQAKKRAEESDRLKSAFLANMSHEIRTPMNSIIGFSSLLEDDHLPPDMRQQYVRHIHSSGDHLLNLINDIIDLSKIEANQLKVNYGECPLNQQLEEIYLLFKNQIENSNKNDLKLILKKGIENPNFIIKTDKVRLRQILLNLLSNALKFTDKGTIEFGYKYREDSVIQFFVKDTGIGIPEERQQEIFSAFQQIEEYASRNYGGTGLGLSITRSLVEKLGGHIWVMSEAGEGARFYFTHPAKHSELELQHV